MLKHVVYRIIFGFILYNLFVIGFVWQLNGDPIPFAYTRPKQPSSADFHFQHQLSTSIKGSTAPLLEPFPTILSAQKFGLLPSVMAGLFFGGIGAWLQASYHRFSALEARLVEFYLFGYVMMHVAMNGIARATDIMIFL